MQHDWQPSTLGHGEKMCRRCFGTNRELAALGELDHCTAAPTEITPSEAPSKTKLPASPDAGGGAIPFHDLCLTDPGLYNQFI